MASAVTKFRNIAKTVPRSSYVSAWLTEFVFFYGHKAVPSGRDRISYERWNQNY